MVLFQLAEEEQRLAMSGAMCVEAVLRYLLTYVWQFYLPFLDLTVFKLHRSAKNKFCFSKVLYLISDNINY